MTVTTLMNISVGGVAFTLVDNMSDQDYAQTKNPVRFSITKGGVTIQKKFPSFKMGAKHYAGIVMNASLAQSISASPVHGPSATNTA